MSYEQNMRYALYKIIQSDSMNAPMYIYLETNGVTCKLGACYKASAGDIVGTEDTSVIQLAYNERAVGLNCATLSGIVSNILPHNTDVGDTLSQKTVQEIRKAYEDREYETRIASGNGLATQSEISDARHLLVTDILAIDDTQGVLTPICYSIANPLNSSIVINKKQFNGGETTLVSVIELMCLRKYGIRSLGNCGIMLQGGRFRGQPASITESEGKDSIRTARMLKNDVCNAEIRDTYASKELKSEELSKALVNRSEIRRAVLPISLLANKIIKYSPAVRGHVESTDELKEALNQTRNTIDRESRTTRCIMVASMHSGRDVDRYLILNVVEYKYVSFTPNSLYRAAAEQGFKLLNCDINYSERTVTGKNGFKLSDYIIQKSALGNDGELSNYLAANVTRLQQSMPELFFVEDGGGIKSQEDRMLASIEFAISKAEIRDRSNAQAEGQIKSQGEKARHKEKGRSFMEKMLGSKV